ncbi:MAG: hypothetical protein RL662_219 [Bacteroidota bacterium]|jgi:TonB-linked SusC/RagA family outer membrane protein
MLKKITLLVCCTLFTICSVSLNAQQNINITLKGVSLEKVIKEIEKQTSYSFMFDNSLNLSDKVDVASTNQPVESVLNSIFKTKGISYEISGNQIVLKKGGTSQEAPKQKVTGKIVDKENVPLIGVSVKMKGGSLGTVSDYDGNFELIIPSNSTLVVAYIGYSPKEVKATTAHLNIMMEEDHTILDEIVVVGYGTQRRINLTGAVDQVTNKVFENRSMPNVTQALQGTIPNLNISLTDGKPTGTADYNIRGTTSIGQKGSALVLIDGIEGDPAMLNPNDISTVTVLKDAASAAIYGARGAFGVVLITTKDPSKDKISITYSGNVAMKSPTVVPDVVTDGYTFAKNFNEAWSAYYDYSQTPQKMNKSVLFSAEYLEELRRRSSLSGLPEVEVDSKGNYVYYGNTDWYSELYKKRTFSNDQNLSISGNNGKLSYYVTGRYTAQDGLFKYNSDDYNMYNLRAKGSIQAFDWLKIDNNTEYSSMKYHNPINVGEGGGIWRNLADEGHPVSPMFNTDGTLTLSAAYTVGDFWYGKNGLDTDRRIFKNTTGFTASFLGNALRVKGDLTFQNRDNDETRIRVAVPYSRRPGVIEYVGSGTNDFQETYATTKYLATNLYTEYENTFNKKHYLKGMVGHNYEESTFKEVESFQNGLIFEDAKDINLALGEHKEIKGAYRKWNIVGGFFRFNYVFDNRYLLEFNGRLDGSSKFPTNEQYGFFPSISGGWRVFQEPFLSNINQTIFSDLKLRASYGSLGNGNIDPYMFRELLPINQSGRILNGSRPQTIKNPNVVPLGLTWETATTFDIGLDLAMLSNRLQLSADYYTRKTTDMFTRGMSLPDIFGEKLPKGNNADMTTKGYEISLKWFDKFQLAEKPFNYEVRLSLSDYISTIDKYNNPEKKLGEDYLGEPYFYEGMRLGEIWGYVTEGFFTSEEDVRNHADQSLFMASASRTWLPGDIKFKNLNNDNVINYGDNTVNNPGDRKIIGNKEPRYIYSFGLSGDWNNFFFSTFFQGVGKQDWYPSRDASIFWGQYNRPYNDMPTHHIGRIWSEENPNTYFPRYRGYAVEEWDGELKQEQTKYLQNVAYLRLKNIQFGYTLPKQLVSKIKMQNARVYLSGENLWSWSPLYKNTKNMDVASIYGSDRVSSDTGGYGDGYNYPLLKSVTFGVSVTF